MEKAKKRARKDVSDNEYEKVTTLEDYRLTDMPDAEVFYMPSFVDLSTAADWYSGLLDLDSWYKPTLKVFGKETIQSRKIAAYATDPELTLKYSGQFVDMKYEYPPLLRRIQDEVEVKLGVTFNHVLLNLYEDGTVYIGNHRDNLENRVIASVSLGAERTFIMTHDAPKGSKAADPPPAKKVKHSSQDTATTSGERLEKKPCVLKKRWTLEPGSLVVMQGDTQKFWKHEIPKEPRVKQGRISLTFRQLVF